MCGCDHPQLSVPAHVSYQVSSVPVREGAHVHISWDGLNIMHYGLHYLVQREQLPGTGEG